ncbi:MAG: hypothetical protein ACREQT_05595 [Candidatus Binataceae bacterium]
MPKLSDQQIANILFNETRSLNGLGILAARINLAHAILNAEASPHGLPQMASPVAKVPPAERATYDACLIAVQQARADAASKLDPTAGAQHFNFRKNAWPGDFQGHKLKTSIGPLSNSYPTEDLPASGIYANTYE